MEDVRLDQTAVVMETGLHDTAENWPFAGDPEIERPNEPVIKLAVGDASELARFGFEDARLDSIAHLRVADLDIDAETIFEIDASFYVGPGVLVLIHGQGSVNQTTLYQVGRSAAREIRKIDLTDRRLFREIGQEVRDATALDALDRRISKIEAGVREALADEEFSDLDLQALQSYPERLAKVEAAARSLRDNEPTWKTAEPPSRSRVRVVTPIDMFSTWAGNRAKEARAATGRMATLISSQQIVLNQRQARTTARFQRTATIVGAAVLVPGLVAAVFGANVGFHGRGSTSAFWAMLALMCAGALLSYTTIRALEEGLLENAVAKLPRSLAARFPKAALCLTGLLGLGLLILGVLVLLD